MEENTRYLNYMNGITFFEISLASNLIAWNTVFYHHNIPKSIFFDIIFHRI